MNCGNYLDAETSKRVSDVSTVDANIDSEDESFSNDLNICEVKQNVFEVISDEQKSTYYRLRNSLESIYKSLEEEIEPVNVRDQCGINPRIIGLCATSGSLIARRRESILKR